MNSYYFVFGVEPQATNPTVGHVSRAVAHIWSLSNDLHEARTVALRFLESDKWDITKENKGYLPTQEQIAGLTGEDLSNYEAAQSEGINAKFYYWHRSE